MKVRVKAHHANGSLYQADARVDDHAIPENAARSAIVGFSLRAREQDIDVADVNKWTVIVYTKLYPTVYLMDSDLTVIDTIH